MRNDLNDPDLRARAVAAARGDAPFDLLITGGMVLDVATGRLRRADVGIVGALIASVSEPDGMQRAARHLDATDRCIIPGLIDTHMHIESSMVTPATYAARVVPDGVTAVCWDPHEFANVHGLQGVERAIAASRGLPLEIMVMAPSCVPSAPGLERAGASFGAAEMAAMLAMPEVIGVAEVMDMRGVITGDPHMTGIVAAGRASGKPVMGHARGLAGRELQGFVAAGVSSDHEITSANDLIAKLSAGLTIELRGSHDHLLPECVAALAALPHLPPTLTICTDDVFPDDLMDRGGLTDVLRRLIKYGMDPAAAIRCATLHAALRLNRPDLGMVAPGRRATLSLVGDLAGLDVDRVIVDGALVAEGGKLLATPNASRIALGSSMAVAPLTAEAFRLPAPAGGRRVRLKTIKGARFTAWSEIVADVAGGFVELPPDVAVMAVIHRHGKSPALPSLAALEDWGTWRGAFATTVAHDSHNLCVFGHDPADMAAAANALVACGGGMAVAAGGKMTALLPLPVAGLVSEAGLADVADGFRKVRAAADAIVDWKPPYRVFKALVGASLACNPGPHLTDVGITDGGTGAVMSLADAMRVASD